MKDEYISAVSILGAEKEEEQDAADDRGGAVDGRVDQNAARVAHEQHPEINETLHAKDKLNLQKVKKKPGKLQQLVEILFLRHGSNLILNFTRGFSPLIRLKCLDLKKYRKILQYTDPYFFLLISNIVRIRIDMVYKMQKKGR